MLSNPDALSRFKQEAKSAAKLSHPNIIQTYSLDSAGDLQLLVMEYVDGVNLEQYVRMKGVPPIHLTCLFMRQAALGLQHAFEQGMVHRDIKPNNMMLTRKGQVKIMDFGLAKVAQAANASRSGLTSQNAVMGTIDYMAPEQAANAKSADYRSDLYSLGCTLFYLLAGRPPFVKETQVETIVAHQQETPPLLSDYRSDVPEGLEAILRKLLSKLPQERYQKPVELAQALLPYSKPGAVVESSPVKNSNQVIAVSKASTMKGLDTKNDIQVVPETTQPRQADIVDKEAKKVRSSWMSWKVITASIMGIVALALLAGIIISVQTKDGTLIFENVPNDAKVYVNGELVTLDHKGNKYQVQIKPGTKKVSVRKDDTEIYGETVEIASGDSKSMTIKIDASTPDKPAPAQDGVLVFENVPAGAKVFIDNALSTLERMGGKDQINIKAGTKKVSVRKGDTEIYCETVEVISGRVKTLSIKIEPDKNKNDLGGNGQSIGSNNHETKASLPIIPALAQRGSWQLEGNELVATDFGKSELLIGDRTWRNYKVSAKAKITAPKSDAGYFVRMPDFGNGYIYALNTNANILDLGILRNGSWVGNVSKSSMNIDRDRWYTLEATVDGATCSCQLDNVPMFKNVHLAEHASGTVCLYAMNGGRFKDIVIRDLNDNVLWEGLPDVPVVESKKSETEDKTNSESTNGTEARKGGNEQKITEEPKLGQSKSTSSKTPSGFYALFTGADTSGWVVPVENKGTWEVVNKKLIGKGAAVRGAGPGILATERETYDNFRLRVRIKSLDNEANELRIRSNLSDGVWSNYAISVGGVKDARGGNRTIGSIFKAVNAHVQGENNLLAAAKPSAVRPGETYVLEISAVKNLIRTFVNGKMVAEYQDNQSPHVDGSILLIARSTTTIQYEAIEIIEKADEAQSNVAGGKAQDTSSKGTGKNTFNDKTMYFVAGSKWRCEMVQYWDGNSNPGHFQFDFVVTQRNTTSFTAVVDDKREVYGTIMGNKISWLSKDAKVYEGHEGQDTEGTIDGRTVNLKFSGPARANNIKGINTWGTWKLTYVGQIKNSNDGSKVNSRGLSDLATLNSYWKGTLSRTVESGTSTFPVSFKITARTGERFKALWEDPYNTREIEGEIKLDGTMRWYAKNVTATRGQVGHDFSGTISGKSISLRYSGTTQNGTNEPVHGTVELTLQQK